MLENNYNNDLEIAKSRFSLLNIVSNPKKIGNGTWRVNPCPKCGKKNHFTLYEPNTANNHNGYWTYSSFSSCCKGGSIIEYYQEIEGLSKDEAIRKVLGMNLSTSNIKEFPKAKIKKIYNNKTDATNKTNESENKEIIEKTYDFSELVEKYHDKLLNNKDGISYFINRGLTIETLIKYKIGYCEDGYNEFFKDYSEFQINSTKSKAYKFIFPILNNEDLFDYVIIRHDNSVKENKYRNMKGLKTRIFNNRYLNDYNDYIFICEGIIDALSIEELGYKAIALNSTSNTNKFIDLARENINNLQNTIFIIALDTDQAGVKATDNIKKSFLGINLRYSILELDEDIKDINELLIKDKTRLKALLEKSLELKISKTEYMYYDNSKNLKVNSGLLAKRILEDFNIIYSPTIGFFKYKDGVYKSVSSESIKGIALEYIETSLRKGLQVLDIYNLLRSDSNVEELELELDKDENILNLKDTILRIDRNTKSITMQNHTNKILSSIQLNFNINKQNGGKIFLSYLDDVTEGDKTKKLLLQEILGYCISLYNCAKKAFLIVGRKDTGKSIFLNLINILVPREFTSAMAFQELGDRFNKAHLYRKIVNLQGDISATQIKDIDFFKRATGGDLIEGEYKGLNKFEFLNKAKFIFSCNELPANYEDRTEAFYDRMILIKFNRVFKEEEQDKDLLNKLESERDFIGQWALKGLMRLINNNFKFTKTEEHEAITKEWKQKNNNVIEFIKECCEFNKDKSIHIKALYDYYNKWCNENNCKAFSKPIFKREVLSNFPIIKYDDYANIVYEGDRGRGFIGLMILK